MEALITKFTAITGQDATLARHFLEAHDWDANAAVDAFLTSSTSPSPPSSASPQRPIRRSNADLSPIQASSRALSPSFGQSPDDVPAPRPHVQDRLFEETTLDPFRNSDEFKDKNLWKGSHLEALFVPPQDVLFKGSFEQAVKQAEMQQCWLMIDLQHVKEFACHRLNRDTWKDPKVLTLLKGESRRFVLWQIPLTSECGQRLATFYHVTQAPYVAILDPITRQQMQKWNRFIDGPALFVELQKFLCKHGRLGQVAGARQRDEPNTKRKRALTDEEQLQRAIEASLKGGVHSADHTRGPKRKKQIPGTEPSNSSLPTAPSYLSTSPAPCLHSSPSFSAASAPPSQCPTTADLWAASVPDEPSDKAKDVTRLQIRLLGGRRVVRRMRKTTTIKELYAFVRTKAEMDSFSLVTSYPKRTLSDPEKTLVDEGLLDSVIFLRED